MPDRPRIVVVGSCNLDVVVSGGPIPAAGETVAARAISQGAGGKGLNQAVAAARTGAAATLVAAVGDDPAASTVLGVLRDSGVDCSHVRSLAGSTGTALVTVGADGDNAISVVAGANDAIELTEIDRALLRSADAVLLQLEVPLGVVVDAASIAHSAGVPVFLTPAPVQELPAALLSCVDVLLLNAVEAVALTSAEDLPAAVARLVELVPTVVVTRGADGCLWRGQSSGQRPAIAVDPVDTTGAGDTFAGALAVGMTEGLPMDRAVAFATAAAALSVQRHGASSAVPGRDEVLALLSSSGGAAAQG